MTVRRAFALSATVALLAAGGGAMGGKITEFAGPTGGLLRSIAPGPDGNMWFVEDSRDTIGRITPSGTVTEFRIPMPPRTSSAQPFGIAAGPAVVCFS